MRRKKPVKPAPCWLISDWRRAHKLLSVQIMAALGAAEGTIAFVPTVKEFIPDSIAHGMLGFLAVLAILGRLVNQGPPK